MTDHFAPEGRFHMHQDANAARKRSWHRNLCSAQQWDAAQSELPRCTANGAHGRVSQGRMG